VPAIGLLVCYINSADGLQHLPAPAKTSQPKQEYSSNSNCVGLMPSRFAKLRIMPCLEGNIQWNTWLINFNKHVAPTRQQEYRVVVQRLIREPSFALSFAHLGFDQQLKAVVDFAKSSYVGIGDVQAFFGNVIRQRLTPVQFTQFEDFFEKLDERADKNEGTVYQSILTEFFLVMWRIYSIPSATYDGDFSFLIDGLAFVSGRPNMAKYTDCAPFFVRLDQELLKIYADSAQPSSFLERFVLNPKFSSQRDVLFSTIQSSLASSRRAPGGMVDAFASLLEQRLVLQKADLAQHPTPHWGTRWFQGMNDVCLRRSAALVGAQQPSKIQEVIFTTWKNAVTGLDVYALPSLSLFCADGILAVVNAKPSSEFDRQQRQLNVELTKWQKQPTELSPSRVRKLEVAPYSLDRALQVSAGSVNSKADVAQELLSLWKADVDAALKLIRTCDADIALFHAYDGDVQEIEERLRSCQ